MPTEISKNVVGKVIQVAGPAVDIQFPEGQIPIIYTAIRITSDQAVPRSIIKQEVLAVSTPQSVVAKDCNRIAHNICSWEAACY